MAFGAKNSVSSIIKLTRITALSMANNRNKLVLNYKAVEYDKLSNLSHIGGKLGHVDDDLVKGLTRI